MAQTRSLTSSTPQKTLQKHPRVCSGCSSRWRTHLVLASLLCSNRQYNNRSSMVAVRTEAGRAAILLDGEANLISFKWKDLQIVE